MRVKTAIIALVAFVMVAGIFLLFFAQEEVRIPDPFSDNRQKMANELKACKDSANSGNWSAAQSHLNSAKTIWTNDVKQEFSQKEEFKERTSDVDKHLNSLTTDISNKNVKSLNSNINQTIWTISAQPPGFRVPPAQYTTWDWVFAMAIGLGFNAGCISAGMYLRKTYRGVDK